MVLNSDGLNVPKNGVNGDAEPKKSNSQPKFKVGMMQSAPRQPEFETKEEEREWIKFRLAQGQVGKECSDFH